MKYIFFILLNIIAGCYSPEKTIYEFKYVRLVDIHKTELGYDLIWKDNVKLYYQFVKDTLGTNICTGMVIVTLQPK